MGCKNRLDNEIDGLEGNSLIVARRRKLFQQIETLMIHQWDTFRDEPKNVKPFLDHCDELKRLRLELSELDRMKRSPRKKRSF